MKSVSWIASGIGSIVGSGFLTYLSSAAPTASFGTLPTLLAGLGIFFVGYGSVKEFFLEKLYKQSEAEESKE